jgi:hypothetical protein
MGLYQLMLENNEKNNYKILYLSFRFEDMGAQKIFTTYLFVFY